eukprot:GHVT01062554.1.p1 GENE.GHVT01062554.1~~GHVT01062554.1.p1  ORF type:complete len:684 (+),score=75.99 GHVT01062554.1:1052-3103(+)
MPCSAGASSAATPTPSDATDDTTLAHAPGTSTGTAGYSPSLPCTSSTRASFVSACVKALLCLCSIPRQTANTLKRKFVKEPIQYLTTTRQAFGSGILFLLFSNYTGIKGLALTIVTAAGPPLFKDYMKLGAEKHQQAEIIYKMPWSLKGLAGTLADSTAPLGYSKRTYMLLTSCCGLAGAFTLALIPPETIGMTVACLSIFLINLQASFNDLLCEGTYTKLMAEKVETGAALTSYVWLCFSIGSLAASVWVGPALDYISFGILMIPVIFACFQQVLCLLYPFPFTGWSKDGGLLNGAYHPYGNRLHSSAIVRHLPTFVCAGCLSVLAVGGMVVGLVESQSAEVIGLVYAFFAAVCLLAFLVWFLPRRLSKPIVYLFLVRFLTPSISSQLTYWLTASPECVEDGPNFSWTFLLTMTSIISSCFSFVGVILFQKFVSKWTFRKAFWITSLLSIAAATFDLILVLRINKKVFHIPDKIWFFLSDGIVEEIIYMWAFMPSNVLISRLCPKNIESTMYSIVAGVCNFGRALSKYLGNFIAVNLLDIRTVPTQEGGCNFSNLPLAVALTSIVCPLAPLVLSFWLIPNKKMDTDIANDEGEQRQGAAGLDEAEESAALEEEQKEAEEKYPNVHPQPKQFVEIGEKDENSPFHQLQDVDLFEIQDQQDYLQKNDEEVNKSAEINPKNLWKA